MAQNEKYDLITLPQIRDLALRADGYCEKAASSTCLVGNLIYAVRHLADEREHTNKLVALQRQQETDRSKQIIELRERINELTCDSEKCCDVEFVHCDEAREAVNEEVG